MKGFPTLTLKRIQKRHKDNPQDKKLHEEIENAEVDRRLFGRLVRKSTEMEAFDKVRSKDDS